MQFHLAEVQVSAGLVPSAGSEGRIPFLALFQLPCAWACGPSSIFKAHHSDLYFIIPHLLFCLPVIRILVITLLGQDNLFNSKSFINHL